MQDDEQTPVPDEGTSPEVSGQTEAEVVTPATAVETLSLAQVERLLNEREAKLRAEFEQATRRQQSKADKAYAEALREAKVIEQNAELLGLDADSVKSAKQAIIDRKFSDTFGKEDAPPQPPQDVSPPAPPSIVTRAELVAILQQEGLDASAIDLSQFENQSRMDARLAQLWQEELVLAKAEQTRKRREQAKPAPAKPPSKAAEVKERFGGTGAPAVTAKAGGYDPIKELEKLNDQDPPDDPVERTAYIERRRQLRKEAGWS